MALVLVVEDEQKIREKIAVALLNDGYQVETLADDASFAPDAVRRLRPSVIIQDRLLGHHDSLSKIEPIKTLLPGTAILVLSAIDSPIEKAKTLDRGADDYLAKPFAMTELLARVKALQRRAIADRRPAFLNLGGAILDLDGRILIIEGKRHHLPNKEFSILRLLGAAPGRIFNKFQILERVWEVSADVESNAVETAITSLRRRLKDAGSSLRIVNSRNQGYWLETADL